MPDSYFLKTEIGSSTKVLIVDETGGFVSSLVDSLLTRRFDVLYFGVEPPQSFDYLSDKNSFTYLNSIYEEKLDNIGYLFYFPKNDLEQIKNIFSIVQETRCRLSVSINIEFPAIGELEELAESKEINFRLIIFGGVYGPRVVKGELAEYFISGEKGESKIIEKYPEEFLSPIYSESLLGEILRLSFMPSSRGKIFFIKSKEITNQEFVSLLKKVFPRANFIFKEPLGYGKNKEQPLLPKKTKEILIFDNVENKIEETAEWFSRRLKTENSIGEQAPRYSTEIFQEVEESICSEIRQKENVVPEAPINQPPIILLIFFCFLSLFVLPIIMVIGFGIKGMNSLYSAKNSLETGMFDQSLKNCEKAIGYLNTSRKIISTTESFYSLFGLKNKTKLVSEALLFSLQTSESVKAVLNSFGQISSSGIDFLKGEAIDWTEAQMAIRTDFSFAYQQASLAQSSIKEAEAGFILLKRSDLFSLVKNYLQEYREKLLKGQKLAISIPEIMGAGNRKTYVILIQNNLELRPTGGYLSAFAIVNLENGKLVNFEVYDIYQADSELKGQIDPPVKIKQMLGEQVWYLRDANFDPQFSYSADKILWFLDKELHISADGIVAITLNTYKDILKVTGTVKLADYNENIDENNIFQKVIQYSEANLGETEKKEKFLVSLTKSLYNKLKTVQQKEIIGIIGSIFSNLENKEALIYFIDPKTEGIITDLGWDGNMRNYKIQNSNYSIFSDFLFINEANFGINKANYFTKRKVNHEVRIDEQGIVREKLTLEIENQSPSENWPAGNYKNYLRVYLPKDTGILSASVTGQSNSWEVFEEHEKTVFGIIFEVPIKSTARLEINYELKEKVDFSKKISSYLMYIQRQAGAYSDDYHLLVTLPENTVPLRVIPKAVVERGQLKIEEKLSKDRIFQIDFAN